jgi:6-pyruvoyltetrahydropterin/6-carboxytetrahydropterin synthase
MSNFQSTKLIELGSCAFRQPNAKSHCRFLHGYRLQSKLWFGCNELDENNWVVDFGSLKGLKKKFETQFDHTTCVAAGDPALQFLETMQDQDMCDLRVMENGVGIERFAEWCFNVADSYVNSMTNGRCWVDKVEVWEHEKNSATVYRSIDKLTPSISDKEKDLRLDHGEPMQQDADTVNPSGDNKQIKQHGKWVDKNAASKPNSWMF